MPGNMKVPLKVEYACRVLAQLGRSFGSPELPHIEGLAQAEEVPANYLVQILNELRSSGLITSRRGKQGGYALARPPSQITLADIVRAIDGEVLDFSRAEKGESGPRVTQLFTQIAEEFERRVAEVTVEDMLHPTSEEMYFI